MTNGLSVLEGGQNGIERLTVPELGDWVDDFDVYGGQSLRVDQAAYQNKLAPNGLEIKSKKWKSKLDTSVKTDALGLLIFSHG